MIEVFTVADLPPTSQFLSAQEAPVVEIMSDQELQTQLVSLKQHHQVQHQMLLQQFHEQQLRLVQEQDQQMQNHLKVHQRMPLPLVAMTQHSLQPELSEQFLSWTWYGSQVLALPFLIFLNLQEFPMNF